MSTHLVGCRGLSPDRRSEERRITDRITVRALRAGVHGDDAVDDLVRMAAGDPRRLARALNRLLCGESNRRVGAQARAIVLLRRALDVTSPQLLPDNELPGNDNECTVDAMGRSSS
jgi:hypothetical protein